VRGGSRVAIDGGSPAFYLRPQLKEDYMIRVMWRRGSFDYVKPQLLDALIRRGEIISFRRGDGVVLIGVDPVREPSAQYYAGEERRRAAA
jgi:hypothetical protein